MSAETPRNSDFFQSLKEDPELGGLIAAAERRINRQRAMPWLFVLSCLMVSVCAVVCRELHSVHQDSQPLSLDQRISLAALRWTPNSPELRALSVEVVRDLEIHRVPTDRMNVIVDALRVVGSAGIVAGATEWAIPALTHPSARVRRAAAVWYPHIDKDFRSRTDLVRLVDEAKGATDQ